MSNSPLRSKASKDMADIIAYYDQTRWDYGLLWLNGKNRAVHFGYYDENVRTHNEALINLNRVLARKALIRSGERVLDAGCGQGGSCAWLAETVGAEVIGITPVASQVKQGSAFINKKSLRDKVRIELGDYTHTRFLNESFDVIWACESICHADEKEKFYREAYRLLKPGGRLIIAEYIRAADSYHPDGDRLLKEWLNGWAINSIDSKEQHLRHAEAAGFKQINIEDVTPNTEPSLRVLYRLSLILRPLEYFLWFLGIRSAAQHGNLVGSIRQYQALQKGYWFYGIISAKK